MVTMQEALAAPAGLRQLAESFTGQESAGLLAGLLLRLARYLGGDPAQFVSVASAFTVTAQLPDNTAAQMAVLQVTQQPCQYRMDGSPVAGTDPVLQTGTIVVLTGRPSIQSFRFQTTSLANSVLVGEYFT